MGWVEVIEILYGSIFIRIHYAIARLRQTDNEQFPFRPLSSHLADKLRAMESSSTS
jgi:hypothetical protein